MYRLLRRPAPRVDLRRESDGPLRGPPRHSPELHSFGGRSALKRSNPRTLQDRSAGKGGESAGDPVSLAPFRLSRLRGGRRNPGRDEAESPSNRGRGCPSTIRGCEDCARKTDNYRAEGRRSPPKRSMMPAHCSAIDPESPAERPYGSPDGTGQLLKSQGNTISTQIPYPARGPNLPLWTQGTKSGCFSVDRPLVSFASSRASSISDAWAWA